MTCGSCGSEVRWRRRGGGVGRVQRRRAGDSAVRADDFQPTGFREFKAVPVSLPDGHFWVWTRVFDEDQWEFTSVVALRGEAEASPEPDTLVNIPTVFTTSAPTIYDIPLRLLGQDVVIAATAERYTWHFGDGQTATSTAPQGRIEHDADHREPAFPVVGNPGGACCVTCT